MSDDKLRAEFEKWAAREEYNLIRYSWPDEKHSKGYGSEYADKQTTAAEHGYQAGYQAGLKAEREAIFIEWENGELIAAEVERLRAELAAAKAASSCPARVENIYDTEYPSDCYIECWNGDECLKFREWLYDRMKERGEG